MLSLSAPLAQNPQPAVKQAQSFDLRTFLSIILPVTVPIVAAGIVGYFGIKSDLKVVQRDAGHTQTSIDRIESRMEKSDKRADEFEERMHRFEVSLTQVVDGIELFDQKFTNRLEHLDQRLETGIVHLNEKIDTFIKHLDEKFTTEIGYLNQKIEQLNQKIDRNTASIGQLNQKIDSNTASIGQLNQKIDSNTELLAQKLNMLIEMSKDG